MDRCRRQSKESGNQRDIPRDPRERRCRRAIPRRIGMRFRRVQFRCNTILIPA